MTQTTRPVVPAGGTMDELGRLWTLGWPVALGGVGMLAMSAVDTVMVGSLGESALAALQASVMWIHGLGVLGRGVLMGVDPIVTQAHGRGDGRRIGSALRASLVAVALVSPLLMAAYWVAAPGLDLLGQRGRAAGRGADTGAARARGAGGGPDEHVA